jgi:tetratricopeptide (TPR) repeat protein
VGTARLISRLLLAGATDVAEELLSWLEHTFASLVVTSPAIAGWLNYARAIRATVTGDAELEIKLLEDTVADFERAGDVRNACVNRQNLAYCLMQHGVLDQAEAHLRAVLDASGRMGIHGVVLSAKQNLGQVLARRGDYPQGIMVEREAIAGFQAAGDTIMEGASHVYLAMFLRTQGQFDEAVREVQAALPLVKAIPPLYAPALGALAAIELERGNGEQALVAATQAWSMFRELGGVTEGESLIRLSYAEALDAVGRYDEAREAIRVARERLLERASQIRNLTWRRSFLEKIRENARTLARAGEWLR